MSFAREMLSVLGPGAALACSGSISPTVTAAGTTQATATALTTVFNVVTTATEGQGVILPGSMTASDDGMIANNTSVDIYCYPPVGYKINGAATNAPMMIGPNRAIQFVCIDGNNYFMG